MINPEQHFSYCKKFINAEADQSRYGLKYKDLFSQLEKKTDGPAKKSEASVDTKVAAAETFKKRKDSLKIELDRLLAYWSQHPSDKLTGKALDLYQRIFFNEENKFFCEEERKKYFTRINALSSSQALSSVPLPLLESSYRSASSSSATESKDQAPK